MKMTRSLLKKACLPPLLVIFARAQLLGQKVTLNDALTDADQNPGFK